MNLSMRARLSLIAAGVVAAAVTLGGIAWIQIVDLRMVDALRARDRLRIAHELVLGSEPADVGLRPPRSRRHPRGRPPGPRPLLFGPDAEVLVVGSNGEVRYSGEDPELEKSIEEWLMSIRANVDMSQWTPRIDTLTADFQRLHRECRPRPRRLRRAPPRPAECREDVDAARDLALDFASELAWPTRIVDDPATGRRLWTAAWRGRSDSASEMAVAVSSPLEAVDATAAVLIGSLLVGGPLMVIFVAGVTWILVGRSLREVDRIQSEAETIAFGVLDQRLVPSTTRDEIAALVDTLNRMLDRLASGAQRQRAFIGDASHELRTPISTLRAQLEVALAHPELADWKKLAGEAHDQVLRMQRLVEDLLQIARLDDSPEDRRRNAQIVDLDDLIARECAGLDDVQIDRSRVRPLRVRGDEGDLRRILRNLLENAMRYGHGRIQILLHPSGEFARLEIEDDGPGIASEDRARVFERFTRLDESRSRASGGAGLGLALCKGLVEAHGGSIEIHDAPLGGTRFVVLIPIGDASATLA